MTTGWPPGLLQDDSRKLSDWFSSRVDARWTVRQVCAEIERNRMTDKQPEAQGYGIWDTNINGKRIMGFTPDQWFDREKEHNAAIERKDALLRQALKTIGTSIPLDAESADALCQTILKELAK